MFVTILAQAPAAPANGVNPSTVFYLTLLFIFLTAIVTTLITKWARDKCLKFFHDYHITVERSRGQVSWGDLRVFSQGIEIIYDHPFVDVRGRKKTSYLLYQPEIETQVLSLLRYHDELTAEEQRDRARQIVRTFNPGPGRRFRRHVVNVINTLRDAFGQAIGAAVGQFQKMNPASVVLGTQGGQVAQIGQTLLGRFANAYEPLLEQYIGQPVIMEVVCPLNPNNDFVQYTGYLADYTQQWIAIFNVEHKTSEVISLALPDVEKGDVLPPLPAPPGVGAPPPTLPAAMKSEGGIEVRVDGARFRILNRRHDAVAVRRMARAGFEPLELGVAIPPNGTLDLPARDARNGTLTIEVLRSVDVLAPRKWATVRHAGELLDRPGISEALDLERLPLVPTLVHKAASLMESYSAEPLEPPEGGR
ncbi:MAG TPA: hypothetical protein VFE58_01270 [Tepidisphaeraceae bacterium]|jgi:hypothetical protein|nr:hypothetical protein [Tepidisphaeraceae bacterium]